jgi:nitrite reductase/ring-hydroxylating ferredoxin subunit
MASFFRACGVDQVKEGRGVGLEVDGLRVAVFKAGDQIFALSGRCPHANGPLGHGWIEDGEIVCPLHHWRFKLESGRCATVPGHTLHRFRCDVRDGEVWVEV